MRNNESQYFLNTRLEGLPSNWTIMKLKYCADLINSSPNRNNAYLPFIGLEHIESWKGRLVNLPEEGNCEGQANHFLKGDVLFGKLRPYLAKALRAEEEGTCSGELLVLRPKYLTQDFLFYSLLTKEFISIVNSSTYGTKMPRANWGFIGNMPMLVPPAEDQKKIAQFLETEINNIDGLISKKERMIELLQEKRQAIITHVVTKGLNPNAPMKDSGIEWIGETPSHWTSSRLRFLAAIQTGITLGKKYEAGNIVQRPYLRVANVKDGYLDLNEVTEISIPEEDVWRYELRHGDVLMTEGGDFDKLGRGYIWEGQIEGCLHQNHIFSVRTHKGILDHRFLSFVLTSLYGKAYFTSTSQQSTNLASTNQMKIKNLPLLVPPFSEQQEIIASLLEKAGNIDTLMEKIKDTIEMLSSYRQALITAAVTGQIDVRGEVA